MSEHATELVIIGTNVLVTLATIGLAFVTYADTVKDGNRTLRDVVAMVLAATAPKRTGKRTTTDQHSTDQHEDK